jgi:hypothetical protein
MQGPVFADGKAEQECEDLAGAAAGRAELVDQSRSAGLIVASDGRFQLAQERIGRGRANRFEMLGSRIRRPVQEVAAVIDAIDGDLEATTLGARLLELASSIRPH